MKKLIAAIFVIAVSIAGCIGQDDSGDVQEDPETSILEDESLDKASPEIEVQEPAEENSDDGFLELFSTKTTVKLSGEIGQKIGDSYLGINEGKVYHFYPETLYDYTIYTTITLNDGLHVLHPEGLLFLENDTATIYSNDAVEEAEFPCKWNPVLRDANGDLFKLYLLYMTADFTESGYRIDENRIYTSEGTHIFLCNNGNTTYIQNGTELADNGCYFTLETENLIPDRVVFDRFVVGENVSFIRFEGKTYLSELFGN
jgi:hypothetical protein